MGVLKVTLFHVSPVAGWASGVFHKQIAKGNAFLRTRGLQFDPYPKVGSMELEWSAPLSENGRIGEGLAQRLALRALAHARYASLDNRLPVILCQIGGGGGEAPGSIHQKLDWLPWVIMDAFTLNEDGLTLTHEAGHCAGLKHPGDEPFGEPRLMQNGQAVTDNLMAYGTFDIEAQKHGPRTMVEDWQIDALRSAYFHSS
ncbi:hypothetical protein GXW74_03770 [Roseomonas eburnea]|uniref:Uncharacterized protein n=1 Tax=Neoroseomonas eburnea TaxID=1346889 RepID=A0A9X9X7A5_9PROT|nr:hypothetical protein [Neoroseomonas eburnea]MBR0679591.1 hypothetical protein [Neoroseomonas eburnea]